jgi:succinoglycan biosynthesis transport protein ExoP
MAEAHGTYYAAEPPSEDKDGAPGDPVFKRYLFIMRRHMWPALTVLLISTTLGLVRAFKAPPIYEATAKILVERQRPRVLRIEDAADSGALWWGPEYYRTQEQLVRTRAVLDLALENPGLRELFDAKSVENSAVSGSAYTRFRHLLKALLGIPAPLPLEPWERLQAAVRAKHVMDTQFVLVQSSHTDPQKAALIANAVAAAFVRYHTLRRMEVSNDVFLYLEEQKNKEERALRESEEELQRYRESTKITALSTSEETEHPVIKRLTLLNDELTQTQLKRIELESQSKTIGEAMRTDKARLTTRNESLFSIPAVQSDPTVAQLRSALVAAESDRAALAEIYGPEHPRMQAVLSRIESLQSELQQALNTVHASLTTQVQMLRDKEQALQDQYEEQNRLALDLGRESLTFQRLQNEADRHRKLYDVLVQRMREVELSSDYTRTNVELVEQAGVPKVPSAPNKPRMVMTAVMLGLLLSIGLALFLEHADDTVRTPDDLELRVGIPVLGFIPEVIVNKNVESKSAYRALVCALEPGSSAIEAFRNIRTSLFFAGPAEESRLLVITSGGPGEGKTMVACNLALVIAQSGKRVLLMDADFRRPQIHRNFSLDNKVGLSSVLVGEKTLEEAVQKTVHDVNIIENLDILTSGPSPLNPTELLESSAVQRMLQDLRHKYDRVIVDAPPVLFVSDASILSTVADGVIVVVRANRNTRAQALRARKQLDKVSARIIGGILNGVRVMRFGHYYSDFYYHGYARYRSDYYNAYYSGAHRETKAGTHSDVKL